MKTRKVLLIGIGGWGRVHLEAFASSSRWKLSALADRDAGLLEKTGKELGLESAALFTDPCQSIEQADYDVIALIVRNPFRKAIVLKALERGVPVLVEKPLVHNLSDLKQVIRAANKSGATLMVSQNYRFEPQTRRLVQFIQERKNWGDLRTVSVRFVRSIREMGEHYVRQLPGGLGLGAEMCIHHYDLMRLLTGQNPVRVRAIARHTPGGAMQGWGSIDAWLEFPGSTFINYHADYEVASSQTGWGGDWNLDFEKGSLNWHPYNHEQTPIELRTLLKGRWILNQRQNQKIFKYHLVDQVHREFANALDDGREPECSLRDNIQSLVLMLAVNHAAKTNKTIDFDKFLEKIIPKNL